MRFENGYCEGYVWAGELGPGYFGVEGDFCFPEVGGVGLDVCLILIPQQGYLRRSTDDETGRVMGEREGLVGGWRAALTSNFAQSSLSCSSFPFGKIALTSAFEAFMGMLDAFIPISLTDTLSHDPPSIFQKGKTHKAVTRGMLPSF